MRRKLEELDLIDDFMMNWIANDERVGEKFFRKLLSVLLEQDIGQVKVTAQRTIPALDTDYRGVRLDVEVLEIENENGTERVAKVYDIEPHLRNDTDFPKSNRFRQAKIDANHMKANDNDFTHMPGLYEHQSHLWRYRCQQRFPSTLKCRSYRCEQSLFTSANC